MNILRRIRNRLSADRLAALLFLAVFAAYGLAGRRISAALDSDVVGPGFFPSIIAVLGIILALTMLLQPQRGGAKPLLRPDAVALAPVLLLLAYALVLEYVGFALATVAFLTVTFRYLGCSGWRRAVIYGVMATAALVALFHYGLDLHLPRGELIRFP
jgi:putative tricarboxylic transport membrane protein